MSDLLPDGRNRLVQENSLLTSQLANCHKEIQRLRDALLSHGDEVEKRRAHLTMTPEEYIAMSIIGWHEVCRDVDGFGGTGIRYLGTST